ncbi:MAG: ABC transporter ATP-binding protein [Coriobacteriia bacterium]|nr:ABC transporter ATP-binding protein [Coriobacteriia bacterium]MBN2821935.1 ABC transporter ATP-binding protein [Coriobacteriia bacterium]
MGGSKMDVMTSIDSGKLSPKKIALYVVLALAAIGLPLYFQSVGNAFMVHIFALVGIYIMLSLGLNIVVGYAGLLDLGYIAFYGMGAYVGVLLGYVFQGITGGPGSALAGFSYWFLLIPAALAGALTGIALGTPVLRLRGDYLAIVTLGFGEIVRIALTNNIGGLTNGSAGLPRVGEIIVPAAGQKWVYLNLSSANFTFSKDLFWYFVIVALVLLAVFVIRRLDNSRLGRAWVAMREDEVAAAATGVNIMQTKLWAFSLGAMWGGVAGITYAYWVGFISPESFNFMESVLVVCMVVLGGMGSIPGAALGAVIIAGLPEIIRYLAQSPLLSGVLTAEQASAIGDYRFLIFGGLMVVMMALRPQGILPSKRRARELTEAEAIIEEENESLWEAEHKHDTPHGL